MSFFKRVFSSIGIGSAKVDTILDGDTFAPGEMIEAVVQIKGGGVAQQIDDIYLSIHSTYLAEREGPDDEETTVEAVAVLDKFRLAETLSVEPGQIEEIPFEFELPLDTPLTMGSTKVWIQTGLDIKKAVDPGDRDYIHVQPDDLQGAVFRSLEELGFVLREAACEEASHWKNRLPFLQEFEFKPHGGPFSGRLDEVEIVFFSEGETLEVLMEVDRRARGFRGFMDEALGRDESMVRFEVIPEELDDLTDNLYEMINNFC